MHGVPCSSATAKSLDRAPKVGFVRRSMTSEGDQYSELNHVVGPILSRDTHILEQYLPPSNGSPDDPSQLRSTASQPAQPTHNAVYHAPAPARRPSPSACVCSRNIAAEFCDQVEPYADKLVGLYFEHLHPCFPIVDEGCVMNGVTEGTLPLHYAVNLFAYTIFYAELSPALAPYVVPE